MNEEKTKMLKVTTDQIESKFGKGSIMKYGDGGHDLNIGAIPTGALPLDAALGIGGVPRGRIIEVYGPESSGKTTLALQILAEAQALGGVVAFIDAEHALDPETTTGGRALKFFSSVRIDVRRIDSIKRDGEIVGNRVRAKVVKNKVAPPFRQAEFDLMYGEGISREGCIVDMAVEAGVAKKSGAWYTYGEERLGQGREAAKHTLKENPDLRDELETKVREAFDIPIITKEQEDFDAVNPVAKPKGKK